MDESAREIRALLDRVRARWRLLVVLRLAVRAALLAAIVIALAIGVERWIGHEPITMAAIGLAALALSLGAATWTLWPARLAPSDRRVARFVEEVEPSLEDRLATAVDVVASHRADTRPLTAAFVEDAARAASAIDPTRVVRAEQLRRAGFQAGAAVLLLGIVVLAGRTTIGQTFDAMALVLFPSRVALQVTPGNARIAAGSAVTIAARVLGSRAPLVAQLVQTEDGKEWRSSEMASDVAGGFSLSLPSVARSFKYRVAAGTLSSPIYDVTVSRAPQVTRIDVDYTYPATLGLAPRTEEDSGDIYAPAGTNVRVRVHTDKPITAAQMTLADGKAIAMAAAGTSELAASLTIVSDDSYRIALVDGDGLRNSGDTEYFIRTLADRPPDVHIMKPARDRTVTPLEEVDIEAQAEDDYGIDRLELVYSHGGAEKVVPLSIPSRGTSVTGSRTLFLEDLGVRPGDMVAYYARARDLARGKRSSETRSDIFFLEVKPFEQEFALAQSQGGAEGGGSQSIDDLVTAQKEIIVATWKLDRRSRAADGAKSEQDIRSVARAQTELKTRVEQTSSSFRESTMRDPRRRPQGGRGGDSGSGLRAGQTLPEEDAMAAAAVAMGKAVTSLDASKTADALPPEMEALNHLLKAQAEVKRREISRQQAGSGSANNRSNVDLSSLFDKELQRQQQTNYETRTSAEQRKDDPGSVLEKIRDLAARQDELNKRQQELARQRAALSAEEVKRQLDQLTREQSDLRERAEDLVRQLNRQSAADGRQSNPQSRQPGEQTQSGQQRTSSESTSGGQGATGQQGSKSQGSVSPPPSSSRNDSTGSGQQMRDVSDEMRSAAGDLRRQDPTQASERGARALQKLQELEQQLRGLAPDERRRAIGDLQMEARQLAEAERQAASDLGKLGQGDNANDRLRRLAGDQERLAERAGRIEQGLKQAASAAGSASAASTEDTKAQVRAAAEAARQIERARVADRIRQAGDELRRASGEGEKAASNAKDQTAKVARDQQEIARALENIAETLAASSRPAGAGSQKLADARARAQQLREEIDRLTDELSKRAQQATPPGSRSGRSGSNQNGESDRGKPGEGRASGGNGTDFGTLGEEYARRLREARELVDGLRREDPSFAPGGAGFTFEGQGMTLSAPGTEAFKQDFSRWQQLRQQATQALESVQTTVSKKLQEKEAQDRLAAGAQDEPPPGYEKQVDSYFKALATKKKP